MVLRMGIQAAVAMVLDCYASELLAGGAVAHHVRAGARRVKVHEHRARFSRAPRLRGRLAASFALGLEPGLLRVHVGEQLLHQFHIDGPAESRERTFLVRVVKLLHAQREHHVVHARGDIQVRQMKRGRGAGAGIFAVDDRDASDAHLAQHDLSADTFLAGDEARGCVSDDRGLDLFLLDPGARKRAVYRIARENFHTGVEVLSELDHAGADYRNFTHVSDLLVDGRAMLAWHRR